MYKWSSFNQIQNWSFSGIYDTAWVTFIFDCIKRSLLIFSKPGCAVQPILIRRNDPMALDTITWTYDQAFGFTGCLWLTLCQFNTSVSVSTKGRCAKSRKLLNEIFREFVTYLYFYMKFP